MGLFPFQIAFSWLINGGYYLLTHWDDPPSRGAALDSHDVRRQSWLYPATFFSFFFNQLKPPSFFNRSKHLSYISFSRHRLFYTKKLEETPKKPWWNRLGESHLKKIIQSRKPTSIKMLASWLRGVKFMQSCKNKDDFPTPQPSWFLNIDRRGLVEQGCFFRPRKDSQVTEVPFEKGQPMLCKQFATHFVSIMSIMSLLTVVSGCISNYTHSDLTFSEVYWGYVYIYTQEVQRPNFAHW